MNWDLALSMVAIIAIVMLVLFLMSRGWRPPKSGERVKYRIIFTENGEYMAESKYVNAFAKTPEDARERLAVHLVRMMQRKPRLVETGELTLRVSDGSDGESDVVSVSGGNGAWEQIWQRLKGGALRRTSIRRAEKKNGE